MGYTGDKERRTVSISNCKTTGYNPKACEETAQKISRCTVGLEQCEMGVKACLWESFSGPLIGLKRFCIKTNGYT